MCFLVGTGDEPGGAVAAGRTRPSLAGPGPQRAALAQRFPARPAEQVWAATACGRGEVLARLLAPPFVVDSSTNQAGRRNGLFKLLYWLGRYPGQTWQQRWQASGVERLGNVAWRQMASDCLRSDRQPTPTSKCEFIQLGRGMLALLGGDVIRPSLWWLVTPGCIPHLVDEMARSRDPQAFGRLADLCAADPASPATKQTALRRISVILAAKGGTVGEITVGDCLELIDVLAGEDGRTDTSLYCY